MSLFNFSLRELRLTKYLPWLQCVISRCRNISTVPIILLGIARSAPKRELLSPRRTINVHTDKSFRNLIKSNQNQIVCTIFRLIWNQTDVRLVPNQLENGTYNLITVWFNKILERFVCVWVSFKHLGNVWCSGGFRRAIHSFDTHDSEGCIHLGQYLIVLEFQKGVFSVTIVPVGMIPVAIIPVTIIPVTIIPVEINPVEIIPVAVIPVAIIPVTIIPIEIIPVEFVPVANIPDGNLSQWQLSQWQLSQWQLSQWQLSQWQLSQGQLSQWQLSQWWLSQWQFVTVAIIPVAIVPVVICSSGNYPSGNCSNGNFSQWQLSQWQLSQ